jgi:hypothetical protein
MRPNTSPPNEVIFMAKREQVTVPMPPDLRDFIERAAAEEDRTIAGQIRHLIAREQRQRQTQEQAA